MEIIYGALIGLLGVVIGTVISARITKNIAKQTHELEVSKQRAEYLLFVNKELSEAYTKLTSIDNFAHSLIQYEKCAEINSQYKCYFSDIDNQKIRQLKDAVGEAMYNKNEKLMKETYLRLNQNIEIALRTRRAIITKELNSLYNISDPKPLNLDS